MERIAEFIRAIVRPTVTWVLVMATVIFVAIGIETPTIYDELVKLAVIFWFVERTHQRANGS
jgi:hypothetical protein